MIKTMSRNFEVSWNAKTAQLRFDQSDTCVKRTCRTLDENSVTDLSCTDLASVGNAQGELFFSTSQ